EIAARVANILGYQNFDKSVIAHAAAESGLLGEAIVDYSEENYRVRGFLDRLFGRSVAVGQARVWRESVSGESSVEEIALTEEAVVGLVEKAIRKAYQRGNFVITGRGSQVILKNQARVLHIRIVAPFDDRVQHVRQFLKDSQQAAGDAAALRRAAREIIMERDEASASYIRRFYHVDWNDPMLYNVVLNTGRMDIHQVVKVITDLASAM
ncbi:MAG TPA: cytidylate kinase-like family protein, partial [Levilinea sp.]|nr:cytidylate kinase-like family protein [Levilinea sp.]